MKRNHLIITVLLLFINAGAISQTIEIGDEASHVKKVIQWTTKQRTGYDSRGTAKANNVVWDVKYHNGKITRVTQCFFEQYLVDFKFSATFCKHYMMENEKLAYIETIYKKISKEKLERSFGKLYSDREIDGYYFTDDFKNYYDIYLNSKGKATARYMATEFSELSKKLKGFIQNKANDKTLAELKGEKIKNGSKEGNESKNTSSPSQETTEEKHVDYKERKIKSKIYDLKKHNKGLYKTLLEDQKKELLDYFKYIAKNEDFYKLYLPIQRKKDKHHFKEEYVYNIKYVLKYEEVTEKDYRTQIEHFKSVNGEGADWLNFDLAEIDLQPIKIQGYEVRTKATFNNLKVSYKKGYSIVKVKSNKVKFKKYTPPDSIIRQKLKKKLNNDKSWGKYLIRYDFYKVNDKSSIFIKTDNTPTTWLGKILVGAGVGALIAFLALSG